MTASAYTLELAAAFCAQIADGKRSIRAVCAMKGMPSKATVFVWLRDRPEFLTMYEQAKDEQADTFIDEMVEIADTCKADKESIQKAKLRIYAREVAAAKMKPKKYGAKLAIGGADDLPPIKTLSDEALAAKIAAKMAALHGSVDEG